MPAPRGSLNGNGLVGHCGTHATEGIIALCEGLKNSALTSLDCADWRNTRDWRITGEAADTLAKAVLKHAPMTDFCGIPLVSLRENSITELDLDGKGIGVPGAIVLGKLLPSAGALTSLSLSDNGLYGVNDFSGGHTAQGIIALCEGLRGSAVTALK